jgi:hypothetical protein
MAWIDPLDRLPPVPQDWGSHVVYGGALGIVVGIAARAVEIPDPMAFGALVALIVGAIKKGFDFALEGESLEVCVGKTIATALWPASLVLVGA